MIMSRMGLFKIYWVWLLKVIFKYCEKKIYYHEDRVWQTSTALLICFPEKKTKQNSFYNKVSGCKSTLWMIKDSKRFFKIMCSGNYNSKEHL